MDVVSYYLVDPIPPERIVFPVQEPTTTSAKITQVYYKADSWDKVQSNAAATRQVHITLGNTRCKGRVWSVRPWWTYTGAVLTLAPKKNTLVTLRGTEPVPYSHFNKIWKKEVLGAPEADLEAAINFVIAQPMRSGAPIQWFGCEPEALRDAEAENIHVSWPDIVGRQELLDLCSDQSFRDALSFGLTVSAELRKWFYWDILKDLMVFYPLKMLLCVSGSHLIYAHTLLKECPLRLVFYGLHGLERASGYDLLEGHTWFPDLSAEAGLSSASGLPDDHILVVSAKVYQHLFRPFLADSFEKSAKTSATARYAHPPHSFGNTHMTLERYYSETSANGHQILSTLVALGEIKLYVPNQDVQNQFTNALWSCYSGTGECACGWNGEGQSETLKQCLPDDNTAYRIVEWSRARLKAAAATLLHTMDHTQHYDPGIAIPVAASENIQTSNMDCISLGTHIVYHHMLPTLPPDTQVYVTPIYNAYMKIIDALDTIYTRPLTTIYDDNVGYPFGPTFQACDEQKKAIQMIRHSHVCIISGKGGSGKTETPKFYLNTMKNWKAGTCFCTVSNALVARKLRKEVHTSMSFTIQRLILYLENPSIAKAAAPPVDLNNIEVVFIDEISMVNLMLFSKLVSTLKRKCPLWTHLVMMGDVNQLPAIGIDDLLGAMKAIFPIVIYEINHRTTAGSEVLTRNADRVANGNPNVTPVNGVFEIMTCQGSPELDLLPALQRAWSLKYLPHQVQILTFSRSSKDAGIGPANNAIKHEFLHMLGQGDTVGFSPGERTVIRENKFKLGLFNNQPMTIDAILDVNTEKRGRTSYPLPDCSDAYDEKTLKLLCKAAEEGTVEEVCDSSIMCPDRSTRIYMIKGAGGPSYNIAYPVAEENLPFMSLSWVNTIHSAQGDESDCVILWIPKNAGATMFLDRRGIYTGLTRGKKTVILVKDHRTFSEIVEKKITLPLSGLHTMLQKYKSLSYLFQDYSPTQ